MFWVPEAQTVQYDDPAFMSGEIWSHYLYNIVLWAPGSPPGMEERVRKALASVDPNLVLYGVDPYAKVVSADFQQENMIATLTTLFGVLGLVLAAVGCTACWRTWWSGGPAKSACGWRWARIAGGSWQWCSAAHSGR